MINVAALAQYAELQKQIKSLKNQQNELKPQVLKTLQEAGAIAGEGYQFRLKNRKSWVYPKVVIEAKQLYDGEKAKAEADGSGVFTETPFIECKVTDG